MVWGPPLAPPCTRSPVSVESMQEPVDILDVLFRNQNGSMRPHRVVHVYIYRRSPTIKNLSYNRTRHGR